MKTYICVNCRHKFTLEYQWMIDKIEKDKEIKLCPKCYNEMINEAVYGTKKCGCVNCM